MQRNAPVTKNLIVINLIVFFVKAVVFIQPAAFDQRVKILFDLQKILAFFIQIH